MTDILIKTFAEVLAVDPATLNDDTSPENTPQWDSLAAMSLVAAIEETFSVELTTREMMKMRTIGIVRNVLNQHGVAGV